MSLVTMNNLFDHVAPALADLGLLTDDDIAKAHDAHNEASRYRSLASNSESVVAEKVTELAEKLVADGKRSPDKVLASALNVPDPAAYRVLAERVDQHLTRKARQLILARAGEAVGHINSRLREISEQTAQVADALSGITDAQSAISANRVIEWQTATALQDEYAALVRLIGALRDLRILPAPTGATSGPWWRFLKPEDTNSWLPAGASEWQRFVRDMARRPWVPASIAEVEAVRDEQTGRVPA